MNNNEAKDLIVKTFENSFYKKNYKEFIINLLNLKKKDLINNRPYTGIYLTKAYKDYIKSFYRIAKFEDVDAKKIDVLVVNLKKESSLKKARSMQRNFVAWYLKGSRGGQFKNAALVAYVSPDSDDWRFSLVKIDYKFENGELVEEKSPAKRYSYLVGANENSHTAKSRFVDLLMQEKTDPKMLDLEKAFSVEEVTDEFYLQYRKLFINLTKYFNEIKENDENVSKEFNKKKIKSVNFTKKLLGQIVFIYFLQKKGWFGVDINAEWGTGPKNFLRRIFNKDYAYYDNFFNDIIEPLFYNTLSIDRRSNDDYSDKFNCKIPFLNGGLFDPINNYDWLHTDILLPNELFSNEIKTKEDIGTGVLDVFDRFNFTVKEDEPLEKEVAVDPEMLGKIFEKLCGVNDNNFDEWVSAIHSKKKSIEKKFNKKYGIYYTPREIVHYMCQGSLIQYLITEMDEKVSKKNIEYFIKYGEEKLHYEEVVEKKELDTKTYHHYKILKPIKENAIEIDNKLKAIKVCDPAVGSGAFPVEMIILIAKARNLLSNYISDNNRNIYKFKREAIENSMYGVDIDVGAVEIAKLRFWLSLIVDEEDYQNIRPLPNLSYKIMQGNSLIEEFEGIRLFDEKLLDSENKNKYTNLNKLKEQLIRIERQIFEYYKKDIELMKNESIKKPYELIVLEKEQKKIKKSIKHLKNKKYHTFDNRLDFSGKESSAKIWKDLRDNHEKFIRAYTHEEKQSYLHKIQNMEWKLIERTLEESNREDLIPKVRRFKKNNYRPFFLWKLHFAEVFKEKGGFDIIVGNPPYGTNVPKSTRKKYENNYEEYNTRSKNSSIYFIFLADILINNNGINTFIVPKSICYSGGWNNIAKFLIKELTQLIDAGKAFKEVLLEQVIFVRIINSSVKNYITGKYRNREIEIYGKIDKGIFNEYKVLIAGQRIAELNIIYKILKFSNHKWGDYVSINRGLNWQSISSRNLEKNTYIHRGKQLEKYNINQATDSIDIDKFSKSDYSYQLEEKILNQLAIAHVKNPYPHYYLQATLDYNNKLVFETISCTFVKDECVNLKFLLGLNNSKLFAWILYKFIYTNAIRSTRYDEIYINKLPCPDLESFPQEYVINIVDNILEKKENNNDINTKKLADKIDLIVYKLYKLKYEEVKIVDPDIDKVLSQYGLSKEDYEEMSVEELAELRTI